MTSKNPKGQKQQGAAAVACTDLVRPPMSLNDFTRIMGIANATAWRFRKNGERRG
jgi:hypothetical protein